MLASWLAMGAALATGFLIAGFTRGRDRGPALVLLVAVGASASVWLVVVGFSRAVGWSDSSEAVFHHVYVFGTIGVPLIGISMMVWLVLSSSAEDASRRLVRVAAVACLLPGVLGIYATHIEPQWLRVDRVAIGDGSVNPLRIGVVADVQTDAFGAYELGALDTMLGQEPDIILVAGDLTQVGIDEYSLLEDEGTAALARLTAPNGVLVISGNTDPGGGAVDVMAQNAGLRPLNDLVAEFTMSGQRVRVLGIGWPNNRRARVNELLDEFSRSTSPDVIDIVLAHSPDVVLNLDDNSGIDLVVSGHTHGGQIQLPLYGPVWNVTELPRNVAAGGLHDVDGVPVYVSTGVGVQRGDSPKVRFGVRPSIGLIEIH